MPKRGAIAGAITAAALVLLLQFKTPDQLAATAGGGSLAIVEPPANGDASPTPAASGAAAPSASDAPSATAAPTAATTTETTVAGPTVSTRFGPVQVAVTVADGSIVDITALQLPSGGRSGRISNAAESILRDEALSAQSAQIDAVSGATYTSLAYEQSLQAALDQAGVATG